MTENEIRRLAHAMNDLRPDWPISSLTTFMHRTELANWTYRDAAVALAWVAADMKLDGTPASETPKRVLESGPWRKAIVIENPSARSNTPPHREDQCLDCGRPLTVCARVSDCGEQRTQRHQPADASAAADQIRARLGWAREEGL